MSCESHKIGKLKKLCIVIIFIPFSGTINNPVLFSLSVWLSCVSYVLYYISGSIHRISRLSDKVYF